MVISNCRAQARLATSVALALMACSAAAEAQTAQRDGIAELIGRKPDAAADQPPQPGTPKPNAGPAGPGQTGEPAKDPREGEVSYEQAQRLMKAVDAILQDTARNRGEAKKLPPEADFLVKPLWTETREDREKKIRELLDAALGLVTDVPVVDVQKKIEGLRKNIRDLDDRIVKLREKQLVAPKDGMLPGYLTDTVDSLSQGHRGDQEEDRSQSRGDQASQRRGAGGPAKGRRAIEPRTGRPVARQRAVR